MPEQANGERVTAAAVAAEAASLAALVGADAASVKAAAQTNAEALTARGQRGINRLWEITQASIAIMIVGTVCYLAVAGLLDPAALSAIAVAITTSYFQRTNHTQTGGVGPPSTTHTPEREHRGE